MLPALRDVFVAELGIQGEPTQGAIQEVIAAKWLAGHPLTLHPWEINACSRIALRLSFPSIDLRRFCYLPTARHSPVLKYHLQCQWYYRDPIFLYCSCSRTPR